MPLHTDRPFLHRCPQLHLPNLTRTVLRLRCRCLMQLLLILKDMGRLPYRFPQLHLPNLRRTVLRFWFRCQQLHRPILLRTSRRFRRRCLMQLLPILKGMGRRFPYHFLTVHLHPFLIRDLIQFLALQFLVRRGLREILPRPRSAESFSADC